VEFNAFLNNAGNPGGRTDSPYEIQQSPRASVPTETNIFKVLNTFRATIVTIKEKPVVRLPTNLSENDIQLNRTVMKRRLAQKLRRLLVRRTHLRLPGYRILPDVTPSTPFAINT
jgi:hypothetical protein